MRRILAALLALAACSGSDDGVADVAPVASLTIVPPLAPPGVEISLDASRSLDADGHIVSYRFVFSDGTPELDTAAPIVSHRFPRVGRYDVAVYAFDDLGLGGRADAAVTIVEDPPTSGCSADGECRRGERCDAGRCEIIPTCDPSNPCAAGFVCAMGLCVCPAGTTVCDGTCRVGGCVPPGTVLATHPVALGVVTGLAYEGGFFYLTGTAVRRVDPANGQTSALFSLPNGTVAIGLEALSSQLFLDQGPGNQLPRDLARYSLTGAGGVVVTGGGGAVTSDGASLFVHTGAAILVYDLQLRMTRRIPVSGAAAGLFSDLAWDGAHSVWAVSPSFPPLTAKLVKIDLQTGQATEDLAPPDAGGLGGVVVVSGVLWGASSTAMYEMVP